MTYLILIVTALGAGVIQTVTGFGAGVFMMLIFPYFYNVVASAAVSSSVCMGLGISLAWKFRHKVQWKICLFPAVVYLVFSIASIKFVRNMDMDLLSIIFGGFLIALAAYFFLFSKRVSFQANWKNAVLCSAISGVSSGLFGIGGPLMAVYFLSATKDKESYIGNMQFFFGMTNAVNLIIRIRDGLYTLDLVPLTLMGIVGILVGKRIGLKLLSRIDADMLRKLTYSFVGLSGLLTLIQHL